MQKDRILGRRIKISLSVLILFLLVVGSAYAVTRNISDSSDNIETFIRNSKGNYWSATGANLQQAVWDLNGTSSGYIYLPRCSLNVDNISIMNKQRITIQGTGASTLLTQCSDDCVFYIYNSNQIEIRNLRIDGVKSVYTTNTNHGIFITGSTLGYSWGHIIEGVTVSHMAGDGIRLKCTQTSVIRDSIFESCDDAGIQLVGSSVNSISDCYSESNGYGVIVSGSYNSIHNIECNGASESGFLIGSSYTTISNCKVDDYHGVTKNAYETQNTSYYARFIGCSAGNMKNASGTGFLIRGYFHTLVGCSVVGFNATCRLGFGFNLLIVGSRNILIGCHVARVTTGFNFESDFNRGCSLMGDELVTYGFNNTGTANFFQYSYQSLRNDTSMNNGTCSITNAQTSVVVTHSLCVTPNIIMITPTSNTTNSVVTGNNWWVDTITSTQFTLHLAYKPNVTSTFMWKVEYV